MPWRPVITTTVLLLKLPQGRASAPLPGPLTLSSWLSITDVNLSPYTYLKRKKKKVTDSLLPLSYMSKVLTYAPRLFFFSVAGVRGLLSGSQRDIHPRCFIYIRVIRSASPRTACPKAHVCGGWCKHVQVPLVNWNEAKPSSISFTHLSKGTDDT